MKFTSQDKDLLLAALNFMLKNETNALQASSVIVPLAMKVQELEVESSEPQ